MNDQQFKTVADVEDAVAQIKKLFSQPGGKFRSVYHTLTDHGEALSPRMFVSLVLVAWEMSIPETVLLLKQYPSIEYFRVCPLDDQLRYIRNKEPVELCVRIGDGYSSEMRTYEQLNKADCRQLFRPKNVGITRKMEKSLRFPDRDYYVRLNPVD